MFARALFAGLAFLLASCSTIDPQVYRSEKPAFDMQRYFNGTLEGHGMFQDRSGQVQRRFVVTIKASWVGEVGTLDEDFLWSASGPCAERPAVRLGRAGSARRPT
jgi:Protein of unknown function (DUF3833)